MHFVTFKDEDKVAVGILVEAYVLDIHKANPRLPGTMRSLIEAGGCVLGQAQRLIDDYAAGNLPFSAVHLLADVELLAPIPDPPKVVAVGRNYADHCRESGEPVPDAPLLFAKFPSAVIGPEAIIEWDPTLTTQVDYEAELAVVIGQRARQVPAHKALDVVFGYTCGNDVSARDLQHGDGQWVRGKSLDTFGPLGPAIVTKDEVPQPNQLGIASRLNDKTMQDSTTAEMIFDIPTLIEFMTRAFTLLPGDVILSGTPHGVGGARQPPVFMKHGDVIEVEIEGLGLLRNHCHEVR
jgi:2-keto-4-pentenoate hydratase/2-oxohepta-3-ene-1,7-dioic acid hydratase in catechol pathway